MLQYSPLFCNYFYALCLAPETKHTEIVKDPIVSMQPFVFNKGSALNGCHEHGCYDTSIVRIVFSKLHGINKTARFRLHLLHTTRI